MKVVADEVFDNVIYTDMDNLMCVQRREDSLVVFVVVKSKNTFIKSYWVLK